MALGFADVHNHQFAQHAFGGRMFWGAAYGEIQQALGWCTPAHGLGGAGDLVGNGVRTVNEQLPFPAALGHLVGGYPQFDGWPRWDSYTHQAVYEDWLKRAVDGGLRLIVMLAVNSEAMCGLPGFNRAPGRGCTDKEAVDLQLNEARKMQAHIDQKAGGPGNGWYRIVETPQEAQSVILQGKLAVVLGIEVDYLFEGYPGQPPTEESLRRSLDEYYRLGVRHIFPIHFADNAYGGCSYDKEFLQGDQNNRPKWPDGLTPMFEVPFYWLEVESAPQYSFSGGCRNTRGLTELGKTLIREAVARGMIIDVDHMSAKSRAQTLDICEEAGYPVNSGHTGFVEISNGDKRHEGNLLPEEVERIRRLGGMVSIIPHQGRIDQINTWRGSSTVVEHINGTSSNTAVQAYLYAASKMQGGPVGFGTDFNGFAGSPRPRFGPDSLAQLKLGAAPPTNPVQYPFIAAATGKTMNRSKVGDKMFDYNLDGLAHVGLLPDMIADFQAMGLTEEDLDPILHSAEGYVRMWEKAAGIPEQESDLLLILGGGGPTHSRAAADYDLLTII
jgi:microsomal dipeptidase-like Zn-dependent dipeptidase